MGNHRKTKQLFIFQINRDGKSSENNTIIHISNNNSENQVILKKIDLKIPKDLFSRFAGVSSSRLVLDFYLLSNCRVGLCFCAIKYYLYEMQQGLSAFGGDFEESDL